jgi:hypothetical protein
MGGNCKYCGFNPCHPSCDFLQVRRSTFSIREPGMSSECLEASIVEPKTKSDRNTPFEDNEVAASDRQVGGGHYKDCAIQPIDYILANRIGYMEANVIKYITRHEKKNGLQDLEKARHYIDLIIEKKYSQGVDGL